MNIPFKVEDLGNKIPQKLSDVICDYTDNKEVLKIAEDFNISFSGLRGVSKRRNVLSKSNCKAIEAMIELALENANHEAQKAARSRTYLRRLKETN